MIQGGKKLNEAMKKTENYDSFLRYVSQVKQEQMAAQQESFFETAHALYFVYRVLSWSKRFNIICGYDSGVQGLENLRVVVVFLEENQGFDCFVDKRAEIVLTALKEAYQTGLDIARNPTLLVPDCLTKPSNDIMAVGTDYLLELFVDTLCLKFDEDQSLWKGFRLENMFDV